MNINNSIVIFYITLAYRKVTKYGLTLHPTKTRLVDFRPPPRRSTESGSIDLLGFTHYWGTSRKGYWAIERKTAKDRFRRSIRAISEECRRMMHWSIQEQHLKLVRKVRGHYAYYGIIGNSGSLKRFLHCVQREWIKWLGRRSQRARLDWDKARRLLDRYKLPKPRLIKAH